MEINACKVKKIKPGVTKLTNNDNEYIFWNHADIVKPYVEKFLKSQFSKDYVIYETNNIDIVVIGENLPIEIQSTIIGGSHGVALSSFEKAIEKQILDNIENYDRCWFFFDSELLRYLQNPSIHKKISINMDWFRKYMKEEKLRVFAVKYNGAINEVNYKDFDFLSKVSMTCKIGYDNDIRILNRNKLKIFSKVLIGYRFNQDEIDSFRDDWKKSNSKVELKKFLYKHDNKRARLYARITHCIFGYLEAVNKILDLNVEDVDMQHEKYYISVLGLFDFRKSGNSSIVIFVDKFEIREYFPGYLRNKDTWDNLKGRQITGRKLDYILKREYSVTKGVDYFF